MYGSSLLPGRFPVNLARMRRCLASPYSAALRGDAPALAQITVDLHALDALPGGHTAAHAPPNTRAGAAARPKPEPRRVLANNRRHGTGAGYRGPPPVPPTGRPPAHRPRSPADAARRDAADRPAAGRRLGTDRPSAASPSPAPRATASSGFRYSRQRGHAERGRPAVTFGSGQADLSPASAEAIQGLVKTAPASDSTSFNVVAYAAGTPDDPSTARRLSLSRALAVRSALMANGVGSSRIYVRALGTPKTVRRRTGSISPCWAATRTASNGAQAMTRPNVYLLRMAVFLIAVFVVAALLSPCPAGRLWQ